MKHCVYFSLLLGTLALAGCVKHDEMEFAGTVLWVRDCMTSMTDFNSGGYVVQLEYPEGVGTDIKTETGVEYKNLVVLYEPTCRLASVAKGEAEKYLKMYTKEVEEEKAKEAKQIEKQEQ